MQCPLAVPLVAPALDNANAIDAVFPVEGVGSSNPFGDALDQISLQLSEEPGADLGAIFLLIAASEPSPCAPADTDPPADWEPAFAAAEHLHDRAHRLHAVRIDLVDPYAQMYFEGMVGTTLDEVTIEATKVPNIEDALSLKPALEERLAAYGCELEIDAKVQPGQACMGSVLMNGSKLDCYGGEDNPDAPAWRIAGPSRIRLLGSVCRDYRTDHSIVITAGFPCEALTECTMDMECNLNVPHCSDGRCVECGSDTECDGGATCIDGACRIYCDRDSDCRSWISAV